jgi:hypothetical protein
MFHASKEIPSRLGQKEQKIAVVSALCIINDD